MPAAELEREASRQLQVCNACRYCEGYCAVFPALERREAITIGDAVYLANLCHDCRACYQACMYTPPHEFAIDIPRLMSELRAQTHVQQAWPRRAGALFLHGGWSAAVLTVLGLVIAFGLAFALAPGAVTAAHTGPGAFYAVVPWLAMLLPALAAGLFVAAVLASGGVAIFARGGAVRAPLTPRVWTGAAHDAVRLVYLRGGGPGCYYPDPARPAGARRVLHQLVFMGVVVDFVSTSSAAVEQDVLGILPPYPLLSVPVVLGTLGGVAIVIGGAGLVGLKLRAPARLAARELLSLDYAFLALLVLVSVSGLALLALRDTAAMGSLLLAHLGFLFGLYATAPYGKFAHAFYRFAALLRNRAEETAASA